jgi:hypothetical protein
MTILMGRKVDVLSEMIRIKSLEKRLSCRIGSIVYMDVEVAGYDKIGRDTVKVVQKCRKI